MPMTPPMELISTMRPPPCARMAGSTCCSTRTQPQKLVSSWAFASPIVHCSTAPARPHPAQATSASIRPAASMPATPVRTESSSSTSMTRPAHPPEVVPRLLAPVTAQPAACSSPAQARPMPADAPVMSTRLAPLLMDYLIYLDGDADYPGHRLSRGGQAGANDPRRFVRLD